MNYALLMIQLLPLVGGLAGHMGAQLFEHVFVHLGQNHRGMDFRVLQAAQLLHGQVGRGVGGGAHGQGDEHFIRVQTGIAVAQMLHLQVGDGLEDRNVFLNII